MNRACFPREKTSEFTKMGEIHELFVLPLSLVWFAGATPDFSDQFKGGWKLFSKSGPEAVPTQQNSKNPSMKRVLCTASFRCPPNTPSNEFSGQTIKSTSPKAGHIKAGRSDVDFG